MAKEEAARLYERALRAPSDNPLRTMTESEVLRTKKGQLRLQMKSWCEVRQAYTAEAGLESFKRAASSRLPMASVVPAVNKYHLQIR